MKKEDKGIIIEQLGATLKEYPHFYLVDVTGLNAQQTSDLRRKCFNAGIKMVVVKNTLMVKALESAETDFSAMYDCLKGTTAVFHATVANAPAKLLKEYAKQKAETPALKAAYVEEMTYIGADQLNTLASIKSKNELIADVIAALESPIMNVLSALENKEASEAAAE